MHWWDRFAADPNRHGYYIMKPDEPMESKMKDAVEFFTASDFEGFGGLESLGDRERSARVANRLLAERVKTFRGKYDIRNDSFNGVSISSTNGGDYEFKVIDVRPIVRESEERRLLREMVETKEPATLYHFNWVERARAVLAKPEL